MRQRSRQEGEKRWGAESMRHRIAGRRERRGSEGEAGRRDRPRERRALSQAHCRRETQAPSESGLRESRVLSPTPFTLFRASVSSVLPGVWEGEEAKGQGRGWGWAPRRQHLGDLITQLHHQGKNEHFLPCFSLLVSFSPTPSPGSGCYDPFILPH